MTSLPLMKQRANRVRTASVFGFLAVALGAFGAHGLEDTLTANGTAAIWETAVFYHFIHTLALYIVADRDTYRPGPWWSFVAGIVIFSGTLYALAITNIKWLGAITPIGGVALLVGWGWLAVRPLGTVKIKMNKQE